MFLCYFTIHDCLCSFIRWTQTQLKERGHVESGLTCTRSRHLFDLKHLYDPLHSAWPSANLKESHTSS